MKFVILLVILSVAHNGLSLQCYTQMQTTCQEFKKDKDVKETNCTAMDAVDPLLEYECGFVSFTLGNSTPCTRGCVPKGSCAAIEASSKAKNVTCYTCSDDLCNKNSAVNNQIAALLLLPIVTVFYMFY